MRPMPTRQQPPAARPVVRWVRAVLLVVLPVLSAMWASWGVAMDPVHGTDLHGYQAVGRAILAGEPFYSASIPGQFLLTPVGALATVVAVPLSDVWLHLGWGAVCALAALALIHRLGVRGFALSLLTAIVIAAPPGRMAMAQGRVLWLVMLVVVLDLVGFPRRPRWLPRGLLTGLATAIWPFAWPFLAVLLVRRRRAGLVGFGTFGLVSVAVGLLLPRMTLVFWTEVMRNRLSTRDSTFASSNHSVFGAALRLLGPEGRWPALLLMVVAGVAAIVAAVIWDRLGRPWLAVTMTTVAVLVASPLMPNPDLAWVLLPVAAVTIARADPPGSGPVPRRDPVPAGLAIMVMLLFAWVLADPLGSLPRFKPVTEFNTAELATTAVLPLLAVAVTVVGLIDALATLRTGETAQPALARFWNHPATLVAGSLVLALGVALWIAGTTDADVNAVVGWSPAMADFEVYIRAARSFVAHEPLYAATEGQWPFLYPPFAAILALPLGLWPRGLVQFLWLALTVAGLLALLYRLRLRGWHIAFAAIVALFLAGPVRSTIGLGQVSILLMVMCLLDMAPGRGLLIDWLNRVSGDRFAGRERLLPAGVLIGIATAIKLTPGLFIPLLWFSGRRRAAVVASITTVAATVLGFIVSPRQSIQYWTQVVLGGLEFFPDPRGWMHNQSWVSAWQRFVGLDPTLTNIGILIGGAFTLIGLVAAIRWVRRGHVLLGASLCGLAALFALPVAWNHYFVWALPLGVALLRPGVPRSLRVIGLLATTWLVTEPFWTVEYAGPDPLDFVRWGLAEKLVAGTGALLTMATAVVALTCRADSSATDAQPAAATLA